MNVINPIDSALLQQTELSVDDLPSMHAGLKMNFVHTLNEAIDRVNKMMQTADSSVHGLETEDGQKSLDSVMALIQEANLAFQEMVQVRNKLIQAYGEVINMQI